MSTARIPARRLLLVGIFCTLVGWSLSASASREHVGPQTQAAAVPSTQPAVPPLELFFAAVGADSRRAEDALRAIGEVWHDGYAAMILDLARLPWPTSPVAADLGPPPSLDDSAGRDDWGRRRPDFAPAPATGSPIRARLIRFLERQTGQRHGANLDNWREWSWSLDYRPHPEYARFKGLVYRNIDPRMETFFPPGAQSGIRLDEIDWGGVTVNGIPPLVYPKTISAADARYLRDDHIVFGVEVEGEARAYPKRILGWHEMARDRVGGVELTVVYCTLCGTVIPYESQVGGRRRTFGTSGLLYRSNKLMFDEETLSLWSTLEGRPVVGPLVGSGLQLRFRPAVTTTWGDWRKSHPSTTVLSLDTGFRRDYSEGAAYREYFSHDRLMFKVSHTDGRLKNKDDVLVLKLAGPQPDQPIPVAIASAFLRGKPVYTADMAGRRLLVLTTEEGASRVYESGAHRFMRRRQDGKVIDAAGLAWTPGETHLTADNAAHERLARVPSHHAFWFGWVAQYPDTLLIR